MVIKEFKVLEFRDSNGKPYRLNGDGDYVANNTSTIWGLYDMLKLCDRGFSIFTIRRLSDDEVFSVGSCILSPIKNNIYIRKFSYYEDNSYTIFTNTNMSFFSVNDLNRSFYLGRTADGIDYFENDQLWCLNKSNNFCSVYQTEKLNKPFECNGFCFLYYSKNNAEKDLETLYRFTTEDGVKIYDEMKVYCVNSENKVSDVSSTLGEYRGNNPSYKYFYNLEDAVAYIKKGNRIPIFKSHDGVYMYEGDTCYQYNTKKKTQITNSVSSNTCHSGKFGWISFSSEDVREEYIKSISSIIFTTNDGVDMYEGDTCYYIYLNSINMGKAFIGMIKSGLFDYFSSKEKALEYLEMNKKEYSFQDLIDLHVKDGGEKTDTVLSIRVKNLID